MSFEEGPHTQSAHSDEHNQHASEDFFSTKFDASAMNKAEQATSTFAKEIFGEIDMAANFIKDKFNSQFDSKLSKLFDGDKPLEIKGGDKKSEKQDWLVAMNLATDFGGECTIEKRTKKLQELAAQSEGKAVTIIVQTAVKDEKSDKYQLERFVIKDGKVTQLKSPGESQGYAGDVESLLKYATQNYQSKNLGLILDSHGHGNEGLTGDNGNVSMADFKTRIQNGLKDSGHDKLDFLQFDACLMAQNGVLEVTQSLAKHVVASAEPEGVTADSAAADNYNLEQLLKNPAMTPAELAAFCVNKAKNIDGFDTLAHFDMSKYASFRSSLDQFGEQLANLWKSKDDQSVLKDIIGNTFEYGVNQEFRIRGGKAGAAVLEQGIFGGRLPSLGDKPEHGFPGLLDLGRPLLHHFLDDFPIRKTLGDAKRDLKDFVERVIAAIDAGKIKDAGGKLKEAAQKLLKEESELTRSFFGRGVHKGLGGLSVYLPTGPGGDAATISTNGGWRQFQQLLRGEKAKR